MYNYADYYKLSQMEYRNKNPIDKRIDNLYGLGINCFQPGEDNQYFKFPENYEELIQSLSKKVATGLEDEKNHYVDPGEVGITKSDQLAIKYGPIWDLPELEQIASQIIPQLEETIFGSHVLLSAVHIYRNLNTSADASSSWLWHYDNNPKEAVKLLIYLSDVDEDSGPFEYMKHSETGQSIKIETSRTGYDHWSPPVYPNSRIPEFVIDDWSKQGFETAQALGPKGPCLFFDNNNVHRATIPAPGKTRDVVIFNIRPIVSPVVPYVTKKTCGSWKHKSPVFDPARTEAEVK